MPKGYISDKKSKKNNAQVKENANLKKNTRKPLQASTVITGLFGVIAVASIGGAFYFANNDDNSENPDNHTQYGEGIAAGSGRVDAPEQAQGRLEAARAASEVLDLSYVEIDSEEEAIATLERIEQGDTSFLNEELHQRIRFTDQFETDEELQATAYQTIIGLSVILRDTEEIEAGQELGLAVSEDELSNFVLYDAELGIAHVSMSAFSQELPLFSMEMVYTEDGWKWSPYSLVEAVAISSLAQAGAGMVPGDPDTVPDELSENISPEDLGLTEEELNDMISQRLEESND